MKKLTLLLCFFAIAITACKKDDDSTETGNPGGGTGGGPTENIVPTSFTQKVLFEEFTGAGQAQCPDGFVKMDNIIAANSATAIPYVRGAEGLRSI